MNIFTFWKYLLKPKNSTKVKIEKDEIEKFQEKLFIFMEILMFGVKISIIQPYLTKNSNEIYHFFVLV